MTEIKVLEVSEIVNAIITFIEWYGNGSKPTSFVFPVTMKWWDEVWLNEGFASYMQVKSLNAIEPSWTMVTIFFYLAHNKYEKKKLPIAQSRSLSIRVSNFIEIESVVSA